MDDLTDLLVVLLIYVGQSAVIAIPAVLSRWRKMANPLLESVIVAAVLAPGPLGYFGIALASTGNPWIGLRAFLWIAQLGAIGGFVGWAVATNLGRQPLSK